MKNRENNFYLPYSEAIWKLIYLFWVQTTLVPKLNIWQIIVSDKKLFVAYDY